MEIVLAGLTCSNCLVYLDDVLVIDSTSEEPGGSIPADTPGWTLPEAKEVQICADKCSLSWTCHHGRRDQD